MPKVTAPRARRSKQEVDKEYSKIVDEVAEPKGTASAKAAELDRVREAEIRRSVEGLSVESVAQKITAMNLEISKALTGLSQKLIGEVENLNNVRDAVALETKELERLHKIDIAATALDQMIEECHREKEELEAEILSRRATWDNEQLEREGIQKESEEALKKQRQREVENYEYQKTLERKKAQDKYDEDVRLLEKKNKEKQETLEKSWQQREAALKEKEEEWTRLKKEVEEYPARAKREIDAAVKGAVQAAEQRFEQSFALSRKDAEAEKRLAELQIKSLQESVTRQTAEIEALHRQLDEAKKQVQDIAVKAIEGASGANALAHVNQIAIEQAKTRAPQS
jgi:DNA repair exonuclease SbcCD ATPase subunit